jgi:hypothetical protein
VAKGGIPGSPLEFGLLLESQAGHPRRAKDFDRREEDRFETHRLAPVRKALIPGYFEMFALPTINALLVHSEPWYVFACYVLHVKGTKRVTS